MKSLLFALTFFVCSVITSSDRSTAVTTKATINTLKNPAFTFIRGHRQGKDISLSWAMTSNSAVNQFVIQCTYEDPNDPYSVWNNKGVVAGSNVRSFRFRDTDVIPGTMHYRIIAECSGGNVVSPIETIRIVSH